jgi:hypothetical protein
VAKQQMAIWELISTECSHIKTTKVIIDVIIEYLKHPTLEIITKLNLNITLKGVHELFDKLTDCRAYQRLLQGH